MTGDWQRLARLAVRRRAELGLTQAEVAQRGPLSLDRVQAIEGAKRTGYRLGTLLALERALEWGAGSVEAALGGGEPALAPGVAVAEEGSRRRNLKPLEGGNEPEQPDEFGLGTEPPFPGITTNSSGLNTPDILNRVWAAAKEKEKLYYERHGTTNERQLRVIQQSLLADAALIEELGDAG
jgi:transcriptional regulator with XRE-family HTH domain